MSLENVMDECFPSASPSDKRIVQSIIRRARLTKTYTFLLNKKYEEDLKTINTKKYHIWDNKTVEDMIKNAVFWYDPSVCPKTKDLKEIMQKVSIAYKACERF